MKNQVCVDFEALSETVTHLAEMLLNANDPQSVLQEVHLVYRYLGSLHSLRKHQEKLNPEIETVLEATIEKLAPYVEWLSEQGIVIRKSPFYRVKDAS